MFIFYPEMQKTIESIGKATAGCGKRVGKCFVAGYLGGKAIETASGRKTSYGLALGVGATIIGTVFSGFSKIAKKFKKGF